MASANGEGPARWQRLGDSVHATTRIFDVRSVRYRHPRREVERDFFVVHAPDWVNVIALTPANEIVLVRQFRYGTDDFSLEIPGGVIDLGEDPVAAGTRELLEETGYAGERARLLGSVHPNPAFMNNRAHFVLVEACIPSAPLEWDDDEEIAVEVVPLARAYDLVRRGEITHALVIDALMHLALERGLPEGK